MVNTSIGLLFSVEVCDKYEYVFAIVSQNIETYWQNRLKIEKQLRKFIAPVNEGEKIKLTPVENINVKKNDPQIRLYTYSTN